MRTGYALIGTSHHVAPVEERERIAIPDGDEGAAVAELVRSFGVPEAAVVNTCNRVELLLAGAESHTLVEAAHEFLGRRFGLNASWLDRYTYRKRDTDAVHHIFRVASSLDSLIVGEPQILGQTRRALAVAGEVGTAGPLLNRAFHQAFRVAKRVRTETRIAENAVSVSYAAVELGRKVFGSLQGRRVLVIGAGKMGTLALKNLVAAGASEVLVANRTVARAAELAGRYGGTAHSLEELDELLARADIVISSTGSQHFVVRHDAVRGALARRKYRPLLLIDIAVPRDIDPRCDALSNVYVYDVDDLQKVVEANLAARRAEAQRAETIVRAEADTFEKRMAEANVVPTIVELRERMNAVRDAELARTLRVAGGAGPDVQALLERYGQALINKILHEPTVALRSAAGGPDEAHVAAAARRLFGLGSAPDTERSDTDGDEA